MNAPRVHVVRPWIFRNVTFTFYLYPAAMIFARRNAPCPCRRTHGYCTLRGTGNYPCVGGGGDMREFSNTVLEYSTSTSTFSRISLWSGFYVNVVGTLRPHCHTQFIAASHAFIRSIGLFFFLPFSSFFLILLTKTDNGYNTVKRIPQSSFRKITVPVMTYSRDSR